MPGSCLKTGLLICTRTVLLVFCAGAWMPAIFMILMLSGCAEKPALTQEEQHQLIQQKVNEGKIEEALQLVGNLIREDPDNPESMRVYGHVLVKAGKGAVAEGVLLRAEELGLERNRFVLDLGMALILQEKYREAVRVLQASTLDAVTNTELLALIGKAELGIASYDEGRVFGTFLQLYKSLDNGQGEASKNDEIKSWLDTERERHRVVEAAFQHFSCSDSPVTEKISTEVSSAGNSDARILQVGPARRLKKPSDAAREAQDGDIIEIDAGTYESDVAVWTQDNLVLRGVGGMAHMKSNGATAQDKGIWFFEGNNNTVEYIEFSGARAKHQNGSGIRLHGSGLTVRYSYFHDNEDGILGGYGEDSEVLIEYSEFARNGYGDGQSHNIYIGQIGSFTLRYSYSHHAKIGHLVKSRARSNYILYNRILDERTGNSSYVIDISEGGRAYIIGNELHKGPLSENPMVISFGAERQDRTDQALYVIHNTLHNQNINSFFVKNYTDADALLLNNLIVGAPGVTLQGAGRVDGDLKIGLRGLVEPQAYNYYLTADSPAMDAGVEIPELADMDLIPSHEYVHSAKTRKRQAVWKPDIGAHEFCGL